MVDVAEAKRIGYEIWTTDNDGVVEYDELKTKLEERGITDENERQEIFNLVNVDGEGGISDRDIYDLIMQDPDNNPGGQIVRHEDGSLFSYDEWLAMINYTGESNEQP